MYNLFYDANGHYTIATQAYKGSVQPPDCIRSESLLAIPEKYWPVLNDERTAFIMLPDHRKEIWYQEDGTPVVIDFLGDPAEKGYLKDQPEAKETEKIYVVSAAQAKIALLETASPFAEAETLLDLVEWIVANCSRKVQLWFDTASNWISNDKNVIELASQIGLTKDQVIDLFKKASKV